jgi:DNA-binding Lrp family transcriptional regulator
MDTDDLDRQLISLLQTNARAATAELARQLGVARTRVILGYTVRLGQPADRPPVRAHVGITVQPRSGPAVVAALQTLTELVQLSSVSGEFDYIAVLQAASTQRLDALLDTIGQVAGVLKTTTSVVLALRIDRAT